MSRVVLAGIDGANPLGFMAAIGLLRIADMQRSGVRLGFVDDGSYRAFLEGTDGLDPPALVAADAAAAAGPRSWWLEYEKIEKSGSKRVADLKPPPQVFRDFVAKCLAARAHGDGEGIAYAAAFATDLAVDGKGNTKPTAFHFTAANQTFLGAVEEIRKSVTEEWATASLFAGHASRPGSNLRWDPDAERNRALMGENPVDAGTAVDAPLEWLAFRGLPMFPVVPLGSRIVTTCVEGRRQDEMSMRWPLWSEAASARTVASLLRSRPPRSPRERALRGIFATCTSSIRRTSQGFGNFGPAAVMA